MKKRMENEIEVVFEDVQENEVNYLFKIIQKHPKLLLNYIPQKISFIDSIEDYTYFPNVFILLNYIAHSILSSTKKITLEDQEALYYQLLIAWYDEDEEYKKSSEEDQETIFFITAIEYYRNNLEGFLQYLKCPEDYKEELIEFLKNNTRVMVYNHLLEAFRSKINENDHSLEIIKSFQKNQEEVLEGFQKRDYTKIPLTKCSKEFIDVLFKDFLTEMDPKLEYLLLYEIAKMNGKIHWDDVNLEPEQIDSETIRSTNEMRLQSNGTIHDFRVLAHEFGHYLSNCSKNFVFAYSEFPAIFFEEEGNLYLKRKGFPSDEINRMRQSRINNLLKKYLIWMNIYHHMLYQEKIGNISEESSEEEIDRNTLNMISYGSKLLYTAPYLIGYYLTSKLEEREDRKAWMKNNLLRINTMTPQELENELKTKKIYEKE